MKIKGKTDIEIGAKLIYEDTQKVRKDADLKNKCNVREFRLIEKIEATIEVVKEKKRRWSRALSYIVCNFVRCK